jgi:hypothetical protein
MSESKASTDGKWVEAVVTKCLADGMSPSDARDFVLGYTLAQILWFWRHPIPEPWGTMSERWEYVAAMRLVYEPGPWVAGDQFDEAVLPYRDAILDALRKNQWAAYEALPPEVWQWFERVTSLNIDEWRRLPDEAEAVLHSTVICPTCGADGLLGSVAQVSEPSNPHFVGTRLDVHCSQCGSQMAFDVAARRVRRLSSKWLVAMIVILVVLMGGFVLWPLVTLVRGAF